MQSLSRDAEAIQDSPNHMLFFLKCINFQIFQWKENMTWYHLDLFEFKCIVSGEHNAEPAGLQKCNLGKCHADPLPTGLECERESPFRQTWLNSGSFFHLKSRGETKTGTLWACLTLLSTSIIFLYSNRRKQQSRFFFLIMWLVGFINLANCLSAGSESEITWVGACGAPGDGGGEESNNNNTFSMRWNPLRHHPVSQKLYACFNKPGFLLKRN